MHNPYIDKSHTYTLVHAHTQRYTYIHDYICTYTDVYAYIFIIKILKRLIFKMSVYTLFKLILSDKIYNLIKTIKNKNDAILWKCDED